MVDEFSSMANRFRAVVPTFQAGDAPLYAHLAEAAAVALETDDEFRGALRPFLGEPETSLLGHRLLAWMHHEVLSGKLPQLEPYYPSVGGKKAPDAIVWGLCRDVVVAHSTELPSKLPPMNQHNEIGRAAPLSVGFLHLALKYPRLPHRLLEPGASAGLLLLWDRLRPYSWFSDLFDDGFEALTNVTPPDVVERRACDLNPVDPRTPAGKLYLGSFVWADLVRHMVMLEEAIFHSHHAPYSVDRADGVDWLDAQLTTQTPGVLTVVYQSIVPASAHSVDAMIEAVYAAGKRATDNAPLAYLALRVMDVIPNQPVKCQLTLNTFPDDEFRVLATCDINGRHVRHPRSPRL